MGHHLSPQQLAFVQGYVKSGNAKRAAIDAGYSAKTADGQCRRLLSKPAVRDALEKLMKATQVAAIADAVERKTFWTDLMRNSNADMKDRLKASELLGKTGGDFIDKVEHSGEVATGAPVINLTVTRNG